MSIFSFSHTSAQIILRDQVQTKNANKSFRGYPKKFNLFVVCLRLLTRLAYNLRLLFHFCSVFLHFELRMSSKENYDMTIPNKHCK